MQLKPILILLSITASSLTFAQKVNPLINKLNQPIDFKAVTATDISEATETGINATKAGLEKIYNIAGPKRTFENTVRALDNLDDRLNSILSPVNILFNASTD